MREHRLAGEDLGKIRAGNRLPDDLVVLRILQLDRRGIRRRHRGDFRSQFAVGHRPVGCLVHHLARTRGQVGCGNVPGLRRGVDEHHPRLRAELPHRNPVGRGRRAAARDLAAVLGLILIRLDDLDVLPIDVQFLGDQHRQHGANALAYFRVLRDDGDAVVRIHGDEVGRLQRSSCETARSASAAGRRSALGCARSPAGHPP